jgi:KaiC/GvpD/RAD55 family RecA-like ATPase
MDLQKKEKEIEQLMRKAQGEKGMGKTNYLESFLVQQLKKQNRALRVECSQKSNDIDELKRNIKLARTREVDSEQQAYVEECLRLRGLLEQQCI